MRAKKCEKNRNTVTSVGMARTKPIQFFGGYNLTIAGRGTRFLVLGAQVISFE